MTRSIYAPGWSLLRHSQHIQRLLNRILQRSSGGRTASKSPRCQELKLNPVIGQRHENAGSQFDLYGSLKDAESAGNIEIKDWGVMTLLDLPASPQETTAAFARYWLHRFDLELRAGGHPRFRLSRFRLWAARSIIRTTIRILDGWRCSGCSPQVGAAAPLSPSQWTAEELAALASDRRPIVTVSDARGGAA